MVLSDSCILPRKLLEHENTLERTDNSLITSVLFVLKSTCPYIHTHTRTVLTHCYWTWFTELTIADWEYLEGFPVRISVSARLELQL